MKRLFLLLLMLPLLAATIVYTNAVIFQWDVVTQDANGDLLMPEDTITYEVYIYDSKVGVADPQDTALLTFIGETTAPELLIAFPYRTKWALGVRTKLVDGGGNESYSILAWSVIDADTLNGAFVVLPSGAPKKPNAIRTQ